MIPLAYLLQKAERIMPGRFARNTFYSSISSFLFLVGRFATTIVVARMLGVQDTGIVNYILWIIAMASALTDLGVYSTLTRYLPEITVDNEPALAHQLTSFLFAPFAAVTVVVSLGFCGVAIWGLTHPNSSELFGLDTAGGKWFLVSAVYATQCIWNFGMGYLQGMQNFSRVAQLTAIGVALQLLIVAFGSRLLGVDGALLGYAAGSLVLSLACTRAVGGERKIPHWLKSRIVRYASFSWASTLASAFVWARLEVAFLSHYWGIGAVGLYSIAFTLSSLATQGPMLLTGGLLPYFAEKSGRREKEQANAMLATGTRLIAFAVLPMCFGTAALAPQLLQLFYGQNFIAAAPAAATLLIGAGLGANSVVSFSLISGHERSDFSFACNASAAVLSVVLSLLLVPRFGIAGAAWARASVQIYLVAFSFWFVIRRLKFTLPLGQVCRLILAAAGCAIVAHVLASRVAGLSGLIIAVPAGALTYFALVRLLAALPYEDVERLTTMSNRLPTGLGRHVGTILLAIAASRKV